MRTKKQPTYGTMLQVWPGGQSYEYFGDVDGPPAQRRLRGRNEKTWREGSTAEWRAIRIEVRAEIYGNRDIQGCDSSLVDELIKVAASGELGRSDLAEGFEYESIRGLYADAASFNGDECREYADAHGLDLPICDPCPEHDDDEPRNRTGCEACAEMYEDETRHGWLTEARIVCQEHAQDNPAEVYEWWRVSSWLCDQLAAHGEVTIDNWYGHWWGRCTTGQQWIMDGVLQRIAASFEKDGE